MLITSLLENEDLFKAELALRNATTENVLDACREYLKVLFDYREELYDLRGIPEIDLEQPSPLAREVAQHIRTAIRAVIEITTRERNRAESLIGSFTEISGYDAAETLNLYKYRGIDNWYLTGSRVTAPDGRISDRLTIIEAAETAGLLRREAYVRDASKAATAEISKGD
jgi:hypothetical protein